MAERSSLPLESFLLDAARAPQRTAYFLLPSLSSRPLLNTGQVFLLSKPKSGAQSTVEPPSCDSNSQSSASFPPTPTPSLPSTSSPAALSLSAYSTHSPFLSPKAVPVSSEGEHQCQLRDIQDSIIRECLLLHLSLQKTLPFPRFLSHREKPLDQSPSLEDQKSV